MKVLFALPGIHRVNRGAEVAFEALAEQIAQRPGFDVTVVGSGSAKASQSYRYHQVRCVSRERFYKFPSLPYLRDHYAYEELTFAVGLWRFCRQWHCDVTVSCGYPYTNWVLRHARWSSGARHVFVTQNGDWMAQARNWEFRHFSCDGLVCTNPEFYERNKYQWTSRLIPNGVDSSVFYPGPHARAKFGLPNDRPVVLMVSALIPSKRVLEGIRAVSKISDAHLIVAGDGELREAVLQEASHCLADRFHLVSVPRSWMPDLYRSADAFLHMSQDEPSANAYMEAMATGLPIVTHDREVTRWTLEDQAILVDSDSSYAVAAALETALQARSEREQQSRLDLVRRRFEWNAIADEYCQFFSEVCSEQVGVCANA
jgi:glycosyltransferase involved in cell wall biosynthesis